MHLTRRHAHGNGKMGEGEGGGLDEVGGWRTGLVRDCRSA